MIYGYIRVSTNHQFKGNSLEEQRTAILTKYPNAVIIDEIYSGAKEQPKLQELISKIEKGDTLAVTKLDRFCREIVRGLTDIKILRDKGVNIHILNMGLIEDTPMGKLILTNLFAFAEFERSMILERTRAGKEIAKLNPNFKDGRPKKYSPAKINHALSLLESNSYSQVADMTGISKSTLVRAKRELKKNI